MQIISPRPVRITLACVLIGAGLTGCQPLIQERDELPLQSDITLDIAEATRLSEMAFHCIDSEYPNKLGQVLGDSSYLAEPHALHPAFYGCFDWHSAVHGHWSLVRLLKLFPDLPKADSIRAKIAGNLTPENIRQEVRYFDDAHNKNYERTYGWAWLLKLVEELYTWDDPQAKQWLVALEPLEQLVVDKYLDFLPKLSFPIRVGEHSNTAFGLSFAYDYAETTQNSAFLTVIRDRAFDFYAEDVRCPASWEPGGFDFLSPCLEEAHLMSRIMEEKVFSLWLQNFIPDLKVFEPAEPLDRSDGKIVHLDGLNFSRAWVFYSLADVLPHRKEECVALADHHMATSLPKMTSGDYAGEHWLASFALYALSRKSVLD